MKKTNTTKKNNGMRTLLIVLLVFVMLFYIGYQAYRSIFSHIETEMAVSHSVFESINADGLVFRSESAVPAPSGGYAYYTIENGTRVAKRSVIASVYSDENSGHIKQEIEDIDQQIAAFKTIQADAGSGRLSLDVIKEQTADTIYRMIQNTDSGNLTDIGTADFDMLSLLSKKQLITGKSVDFSAKIKELQKRKANLKASYRAPKSKVYAPVAGYFADRSDGYESILTTRKLSSLDPAGLKKLMETDPKATSKGGKIVSGYEWYMACLVPESYYNQLRVGRHLSLNLSFVLEEPVPVTVYSCSKPANGKLAVVFRCDYMSAELSTIRKESVEIQLVEHTGLKVPKRAILINDKQEAGVYVRSGNVVTFRKIEQLYSEPADYAVCKIVNKDGYLRMYDDIIVEGRDLYDGKIIR